MKLTKEHLLDAVYQLSHYINEHGGTGGGGETVMINAVHNYSTEEHMIGTWIDGSPLYQRTIITEALGSNDMSLDLVQLTNENIIKLDFNLVSAIRNEVKPSTSYYEGAQGWYYVTVTDLNTIRIYRSGAIYRATWHGEITIQYTKTNDSPITPQTTLENAINNTTFSSLTTDSKNLVGAINEVKKSQSQSYSTEEQVVGTWIDGKPIYQKTYTNLGIATTPENVWFDIVNVGELNIDTLLSCYANPSKTTTMALSALVDGTMLKGFFNTLWMLNTVTIQYTKTAN